MNDKQIKFRFKDDFELATTVSPLRKMFILNILHSHNLFLEDISQIYYKECLQLMVGELDKFMYVTKSFNCVYIHSDMIVPYIEGKRGLPIKYAR